MATPRFFLRVGSWYKSFTGKSLSSDLEITSVVNDADPNEPFIEDNGSGATGGVSIPATAYASNVDAVAALGVGVLYKSTTLINGSPIILLTV